MYVYTAIFFIYIFKIGMYLYSSSMKGTSIGLIIFEVARLINYVRREILHMSRLVHKIYSIRLL